MIITFMSDKIQWDDRNGVELDEIIDVQLTISDASLSKVIDLKELNSMVLQLIKNTNFYYFQGKILEIKPVKTSPFYEILIDCSIPIRALEYLQPSTKKEELDYSVGDTIEGLGYLNGYISFDPGKIHKSVYGKVKNINKIKVPINGLEKDVCFLIEIDISPEYPKPRKLVFYPNP